MVTYSYMIDLHTHSLLSDGELIASELVRRAGITGYSAIGITDHCDSSNLDFVISNILKAADDLNRNQSVLVIPGVELTHVPTRLIGSMVKKARESGAALIIVHGETIVEPVEPGTNRAAIEAGADILAHPGLITYEDAMLAAKKGILLELSGRSGHSFTNGHVAKISIETGVNLCFDSDAHAPGDLIPDELAAGIVEGAGMSAGALEELLSNSRNLLQKIGYPLSI